MATGSPSTMVILTYDEAFKLNNKMLDGFVNPIAIFP